jgi:hypothetical protein
MGKVNNESASVGLYGESWSLRTDTRVGANLLVPMKDYLSLVGQVVAEGYSYENQDHYEPDIDLLFVSYQLTPEVSIRAGRLRTPFFLISEFSPVGYAYPWISPPETVYNPILQSVLSKDGIDLTLNRRLFGGNLAVSTLLGTRDGKSSGNNMESEISGGVNITLSKQIFTARYSFQVAKSSQNYEGLSSLVAAYRGYQAFLPPMMGNAFGNLADAHELDDAWVRYHALGFQYRQSDWRWDVEMNHIPSADEGFSPEVLGAFISVSRYAGDFEYFAMVGHHKVRLNNALENALNTTLGIIPLGADAQLDQLRTISGVVGDSVDVEYDTVSLGVRWDVLDTVALKYNIGYTQDHKDPGVISQPADVVLHRISMDMVF